MNKNILIVMLFLMLISACVQKDKSVSQSNLVMLSNSEGFNDKRFNNSVLRGLNKAAKELNLKIDSIDLKGKDFKLVLNEQLKLNRKAIFVVNPENQEYLLKAVSQYPQIQFIVIGNTLDKKYDNLKCIDFNVSEVSFLTGYVAAVWTDIKSNGTGKVAFYHYVDARRNVWKSGFHKGIEHYNKTNNRKIGFIDKLENNNASKETILSSVSQLSKQGVYVYFIAVAENNETAYQAVRDNGKYLVGQEVDFFYIYPELQDITITSGIINVENYVYNFLKDLNKGEADFSNYYGNFENSGIDIAPFHSFDTQLSNKIKSDISALKMSKVE